MTAPLRKTEILEPFEELDVVSLARTVRSDDGDMSEGARGTVVASYGDGVGYEVEFDHPFHAVLTLKASDLRA